MDQSRRQLLVKAAKMMVVSGSLAVLPELVYGGNNQCNQLPPFNRDPNQHFPLPEYGGGGCLGGGYGNYDTSMWINPTGLTTSQKASVILYANKLSLTSADYTALQSLINSISTTLKPITCVQNDSFVQANTALLKIKPGPLQELAIYNYIKANNPTFTRSWADFDAAWQKSIVNLGTGVDLVNTSQTYSTLTLTAEAAGKMGCGCNQKADACTNLSKGAAVFGAIGGVLALVPGAQPAAVAYGLIGTALGLIAMFACKS